MTLIPVSIYSHTEHDEGREEEAREDFVPLGIRYEDAVEFLGQNPLYEVEFRYTYNTETHEFKLRSVHTGEGEPVAETDLS